MGGTNIIRNKQNKKPLSLIDQLRSDLTSLQTDLGNLQTDLGNTDTTINQRIDLVVQSLQSNIDDLNSITVKENNLGWIEVVNTQRTQTNPIIAN